MMENDTPIYVNNTHLENVESYIYLGQRYTSETKPRQGDSKKNRHGNSGNIDTNKPIKEQVSSCSNTDGKEYIKHHIPGKENKHLGKRKDKGHRRD